MKGTMADFKILILAYLIGHSPIDTQQTFQMQGVGAPCGLYRITTATHNRRRLFQYDGGTHGHS